jgi:hypothetical protein
MQFCRIAIMNIIRKPNSNGGGGGGWNILQRPDGMSDEQAYQLIKEALGYTFSGPWLFTLPLP